MTGRQLNVASMPDLIPKGMSLVNNPGGGNCLFHAMATGLKDAHISTHSTATMLRAKAVTHLRKYMERYRTWWDGHMPDDSQAPAAATFEDYVSAVEKPGNNAGYLVVGAFDNS